MAEDRQSSKRDSCAWFQPCAASPMNQPESRDQALLRARRLHWAIGHSLPKRRTRSKYRPTQTHESFFHYQGTAAVDTRLSSFFEEERERKRGCALNANHLPNTTGLKAPTSKHKNQ